MRSDKGGICGLWFPKVCLRRCLFAAESTESVFLECLWAAFVQLFPFLFAMLVSLQRLDATHEACCSSASVAVHKMCVTHLKRVTRVRSNMCTGICKMSVVCLGFWGGFITLYIATLFLTIIIGRLARHYRTQKFRSYGIFDRVDLTNNSHFTLSPLCLLGLWL